MLLKAAINGKRSPKEHPAIPINPGQQAHQAAIAVKAGAGAIHVHPRDENGDESLASDDVAAALQAIRAECPTTPIGVSTGAWMAHASDSRILFCFPKETARAITANWWRPRGKLLTVPSEVS